MFLSKCVSRFFPERRALLSLLLSFSMLSITNVYAQTPTNLSPDNSLPPTLNSPYDTLPATPTKTPEYVVIKSSDQVTYSSETAASILELNVKEGSHFKTGDVLLKLDCRIQSAELAKAIAQANSANLAEQSAQKLKSYGSISELELVKARSDAAIARAEVSKLNAIVEKCIIKAPFNGSVAQLMVHPLESVKPGDPLMKVMNTENLEFEIQVPSNWLQWLKVGSKFYVHLNEINKKVTVEVIRIDPEIESVSQTIKITGQITQPDPSLLPGMSGQAIFPDNPENKENITKNKSS